MKNISIMFVAALSIATVGCKKKGGDCEKAIANGLELSKDTMTKAHGVDDKMLAKMRDLGVKTCQEDKWSDEATKCMVEAKSQTEAQGCYGKLTPEQQAKMNKAAMALATPAANAAPAPAANAAPAPAANAAPAPAANAAPAPADTGSAAGSAVAPK